MPFVYWNSPHDPTHFDEFIKVPEANSWTQVANKLTRKRQTYGLNFHKQRPNILVLNFQASLTKFQPVNLLSGCALSLLLGRNFLWILVRSFSNTNWYYVEIVLSDLSWNKFSSSSEANNTLHFFSFHYQDLFGHNRFNYNGNNTLSSM